MKLHTKHMLTRILDAVIVILLEAAMIFGFQMAFLFIVYPIVGAAILTRWTMVAAAILGGALSLGLLLYLGRRKPKQVTKCESYAQEKKMTEIKELIYRDDARAAILRAEPRAAYCIDRVKPVDAVEVVRCKDCKHWVLDHYGCVCNLHSEKENEDYPAFDVQMLPNDFCSYGERKDNG